MSSFDAYLEPRGKEQSGGDDEWQEIDSSGVAVGGNVGGAGGQRGRTSSTTPTTELETAAPRNSRDFSPQDRKQRPSLFSFKMSPPSFSSIMGGKERAGTADTPASPLPERGQGGPSDSQSEAKAREALEQKCELLQLRLDKELQNGSSLLDLYETIKAQLEKCNERSLQTEQELKQEKENTSRLETLLRAKESSPGGAATPELSQLQAELKKLQDQRDAAQADAREVNERLRSYLTQLRESKVDKEQLQKQLRQAQEDLLVSQQETQDVKAEAERGRLRLGTNADAMTELQAEVDRLAQELRQAEADKVMLEKEKADNVRLWREEMRKKRELQREVSTLLKEKSEGREQGWRSGDADAVAHRLEQREQELEESRAASEGLRKQLQELQQELESVKARGTGSAAEAEEVRLREQQQAKEQGELLLLQHQEALRGKEEEAQKLRGELSTAQAKIEELSEELASRVPAGQGFAAGAGERDLAGLQAELEAKDKEIQQLRQEIEQWDLSYTESERRVASLENSVNQLVSQKEGAIAVAVQQMSAKLQQVESDLAAAETAREHLERKLEEVTAHRDQQVEALGAHEREVADLVAEKQALEKRLEQVASLEHLSELLQTKAQEKELAFQKKDAECQGLKEDLVARDIRMKKLQMDVVAMQRQLESTDSAFKDEPSVRGELMEAQQEIRKLHLEKEQAKQAHLEQMEGFAVRIRDLEAIEEAYKGQHGSASGMAVAAQVAAKRDLDASLAEAAQLRQELSALRSQAAERQLKFMELEASLEQSRREASDLHQENQQSMSKWQARVSQLEGMLEGERSRASQAEGLAEAQAERRARDVQDRVQQEIDFLKGNAMSSLQEIQALEGVLQRVEAYDVRLQPLHRLRLLQHGASFACAICHAQGTGWAWRCVVPHCHDSIHLNCLTGRGGR